jgi:hypothetical protein
MEQEFETKPQEINGKEQFEKMASELLKEWKDYKKLDSRMKLLDASTKKYMIDHDIKFYENENGTLNIVKQNQRVLDRALIQDIESYKVDTKRILMYKSSN